MLKFKMLLITAAVASAALMFCEFGTSGESTRTVKALQISSTEISPWTEDADGFRDFSSLDGLTSIMNGGADEYYNRNAVDGFFQNMSNKISESTTYSVECRVINFGTVENATTMFNFKTQDISTKDEVGSLGLSVALIDPDASLTGCAGYAHFGQYYFELNYSGYGSSKSQAKQDAASFIEVFQDKVKKL